jgi:hypothetical protein
MVRELVTSYAEKENCLILVVTSMKGSFPALTTLLTLEMKSIIKQLAKLPKTLTLTSNAR